MAAWLLTITGTQEVHWDRAKKAGFWDMVALRKIRSGDAVYFWLTGSNSRLLGKVRAVSDTYEISTNERPEGPWKDWPTTDRGPYKARFRLETLWSPELPHEPWGSIQRATGLKQNTPTWVRQLTAFQSSVLDRMLGAQMVPAQSLDDARRERIFDQLDEDLRVRRYQLVAIRQGQPEFRGALLRAYGGRCAITGTDTESVLEAAHISPHKGEHTNEVWNGLLLRADIHTLFDLFHLTVEAKSLNVRVSPALQGTEYEALEGTVLTVPSTLDKHLTRQALAKHNEDCADWLGR